MKTNINKEVDEDGFSKLSLNYNSTNNKNFNEKRIFCRNFNTPEGCKFKDKCKFMHETRKKTSNNDLQSRVNYKTKSSLCKNFLSTHIIKIRWKLQV